FLCSPSVGRAQQSLSLSVTPTLFEMSANPGQLWQSSIKVVNTNPYDLTVYASVVNFAPQGETGQGKFVPVFEQMTEGATFAEWISFEAKPITIEREKSQLVPFIVEVPEDASPGGHFAAILISTQPPKSDKNALAVRTAQVVTSLFFVRVAGDVNESGSIRSFTTTDSFHEAPEATFELRFENKGNVHLQPRGDIRIYNMWGKERGVIPINHQTHFGNVLPASIRKFEFSWTGEQSITDIGRYKAVASLAYGLDGSKFTTSATYFWIVPVKSLLITLGSLVALVFLVSWIIKLYVRRMLFLAGVPTTKSTETGRPYVSEKKDDIHISSYKRISAPVRTGYLDLRARLEGAKASMDVFRTIFTFAIAYKLFFAGLIIILMVIVLSYYFISDVTNTEKTYDITIANPDSSLNLSSEEIAFTEIATREALPAIGELGEQLFDITLINTSGTPGTAAIESANLVKAGYGITSLSMSTERTDKKSVIVFDPTLQATALEISKGMGGALLSARTGSSTNNLPNITVFVGADRVAKK
ncbi:LytR C-terminal domain-containing protein, partial [Candidatus Pacebacteria bacterium]|nr:LytR C-terminal domain-containing protein [Candidatus Paceibacterota bacterium]